MAYLERTNVINSSGTVINPATEDTSTAINNKLPALTANGQMNVAGYNTSNDTLNVYPRNISTFREAFQTYTPNTTWTELKGTGDLIYVDGNSGSASYLVISKDPLTANTESSITTTATFSLPIEFTTGVSLSQRTLGQEFSIEVIDTPGAIPAIDDIQIANISQATTALTVDTVSPHGLSAGMSIGVRGCVDQRVNYPALVVTSITSPTQFITSLGPAGTIVSQTSYASSVLAATTAALPTSTYNNGTAGVGATLTATTNGAFPDQDGVPIPLGSRVLVKNQSNGFENGIYSLTTVGDAGTAWVLTRATDFDTTAKMTIVASALTGISTYVSQGNTQAQKTFYLTATVTTVGTTSVVFADSGGTQPAVAYVYMRTRMSRASNGLSEIFEIPSATSASLYIRGDAGDVLPSGTVAGNQTVTVGTTASVQLVNAPYQYSFAPTTEFRFFVQSDRTQWADSAVDATAQTTNRLLRTQVCPNPTTTYRIRYRANNNKSLTVPNAQIVSADKSGSTTATITTDVNHGLLSGDTVVIYGIRDQAAASFPNIVTATAVTVLSPTTFSIVIGSGTVATSYGGYVAKIQAGNLMSALGANTTVIQSASLTTLADGTRQLNLVGSATWAGFVTGDLINIVGCRDISTGASLGVDGVWKVATVTGGTALPLVLPYSGSMSLPSNFASINCGGGVIKRTDFRISFARIFDYARERVEMLARPALDAAGSVPSVIQGGTLGSVTTVTTVSTVTAVTGITNALPAGTNSLGYIGMNSDTRTDLTRNTYANGIRRNLNFS